MAKRLTGLGEWPKGKGLILLCLFLSQSQILGIHHLGEGGISTRMGFGKDVGTKKDSA